MKSLTLAYGYFDLNDDVLTVRIKEDTEVTLELMKEMLDSAVEFTEKKPYYAIVDLSKNISDTPESRNYYATSPHRQYRKADALIVNSLAVRMLANFFLKFNKPSVPTQIFSKEADAIHWIHQLKKKESQLC